MNDHKILDAIRAGHATSTAIATATSIPLDRTQNALNRLLNQGRVVRSKTASSYEWKVAT